MGNTMSKLPAASLDFMETTAQDCLVFLCSFKAAISAAEIKIQGMEKQEQYSTNQKDVFERMRGQILLQLNKELTSFTSAYFGEMLIN